MLKEAKNLILKVSLIAFFIIVLNVFYFAYQLKSNSFALTGYSIQGEIYEIYSQLPIGSKLFLLFQWVLIMVIILYSVFRGIMMGAKKDELVGIDLKQMQANAKTDLDALYNVLKYKRKLRISSVAKLFNIKKETAMQWSEILESGGIAKVEFPAIGEPTLELAE